MAREALAVITSSRAKRHPGIGPSAQTLVVASGTRLDHIFICTSVGGPEAQALIDTGFVEGTVASSRTPASSFVVQVRQEVFGNAVPIRALG